MFNKRCSKSATERASVWNVENSKFVLSINLFKHKVLEHITYTDWKCKYANATWNKLFLCLIKKEQTRVKGHSLPVFFCVSYRTFKGFTPVHSHAWRPSGVLSSHLGSLRCAGWVDSAGFHTVGLVSATQSEATFPPPFVTIGQRAITPEHTHNILISGSYKSTKLSQ